MNSTSVVSQPSVSAHVLASVSFPKSRSTYGIVCTKTALKGGTCIRNGADRFMQYRPLSFAFCAEAALMDSGETVAKKPALYTIFASWTTFQLSGSLQWSAL